MQIEDFAFVSARKRIKGSPLHEIFEVAVYCVRKKIKALLRVYPTASNLIALNIQISYVINENIYVYCCYCV